MKDKDNFQVMVDELPSSKPSQERPVIDQESQLDDAWLPGKYAPWIAAAEIFLAVLCTVAAITVVQVSNGKRQGSWYFPATKHTKQLTIEPKLLLSMLSSVTTLVLGLALKEGITVSWWRRALIGGRVKDLERHWSYGSSVLRAAMAGKYINHVAVGLLLITVTGLTESTLMQRATNVVAQPVKDASSFQITTQLASTLPYTGFMAQEALARITTNLDPVFAGIMRDYTNRAPINSSFTGCDGTCTAVVPGAGLAVDCTPTFSHFTMGPTIFNKTYPSNSSTYYPESWNKPYTVFDSSFTLGNPDGVGESSDVDPDTGTYEAMHMQTISSQAKTLADGDCFRNVTTTKCRLRPAIVNYPVIINDNLVSLDKSALNGSQFFHVEKYLHLNDDKYQFTRLGGIYLAFSNYFTSHGTLAWQNQFGDGYFFNGTGSQVFSYLGLTEKTIADFTYGCDVPLLDPTSDIMSALNDVMFRMAVNASSADDRTKASAVSTGLVNYYQSSFLFLGIAIAIVWLNVFVIVPLFWGWWELGRKVSLNPVEVAEAFNAPILRKDVGHRNIDGLLKHVGDRPLVFKPVEHRAGADGERRVITRMEMVQPDVEMQENHGQHVHRHGMFQRRDSV
jgi:hypothetical protein